MKFGLSQQTISKINSVFASYPEVDEAILYGSRAKGNYKPGSDIDLTLNGTALNLDVMNGIGNRIDDLSLPYMVDLSIFKQISDADLVEHINRVGVLFYKKENSSNDSHSNGKKITDTTEKGLE